MDEFAKLFTVKGGYQVLVKKGEEEDGSPQLIITSRINGVEGKMGFSYDKFEDRDKAFEKVSADQALVFFRQIEKILSINI